MTHSPVPVSRSVPALYSLRWLKSGWLQFVAQPWHWAALSALIFVMILALGPIPVIGPIIVQLLLQIMAGGMLAACARSAQGRRFRFRDYFDGFRQHAGNLAIIGLLYALAVISAELVLMATFGGGLVSQLIFGTSVAKDVLAIGLAIAAFAFMVIWFVLLLALWFAPALVMFGGQSPFAAMQLSFRACVQNLGTILLLCILLCTLAVLAVLPAGLGLPVLFPVVAGAAYTSFVDIFGQTPTLPSPEDTP